MILVIVPKPEASLFNVLSAFINTWITQEMEYYCVLGTFFRYSSKLKCFVI